MISSDSEEVRRRASNIIARGGIVAFRTDTFYGLGVNPFDEQALRSLNDLKGREAKPILVIISDRAQADRFVKAKSALFEILAAHYWPGALTIVEEARQELSAELTANTKTIGVRLPDDEQVRDFVRTCGGALTATSANLAGQTPARTALEVLQTFLNKLDLVVDSGLARGGKPSTVIDISKGAARLIREGIVSRRELAKMLEVTGAKLEENGTAKHNGE